MGNIINFQNFTPTTKVTKTAYEGSAALKTIDSIIDDQNKDRPNVLSTIELLTKMHPGRMVYTQKEAAKILSLSYQFVNKKCVEGEIRTVKFGDRQLININEIAKLINEGIYDGN